MLSVLPEEGMVKGSLSYQRRNAFGLSALERVVSAEYWVNRRKFWLFVAIYSTEEEALSALSRLGARGIRDCVEMKVPFYGRVKAFRWDRFLYGSLGDEPPPRALDCLRRRISAILKPMGTQKDKRGGERDGKTEEAL